MGANRWDMSAEEVARCLETSHIAHDEIRGGRLYDALNIGECLLIGRRAAMKVAGVNVPNGRRYADEYRAWKAEFGYDQLPSGDPLPEKFWLYDDCIVCAEHRILSEEIIDKLPLVKRAALGISGLAKRVRQELADRTIREPKAKKPSEPREKTRKERLGKVEGEINGLKEKRAQARSCELSADMSDAEIAATVFEMLGSFDRTLDVSTQLARLASQDAEGETSVFGGGK